MSECRRFLNNRLKQRDPNLPMPEQKIATVVLRKCPTKVASVVSHTEADTVPERTVFLIELRLDVIDDSALHVLIRIVVSKFRDK